MTAHETREQKEIRNRWIVEQFQKVEENQQQDAIAAIAVKLNLTEQRVRDILSDSKVLNRKRHSEARRVKKAILDEVRQLAPHERPAAINRLAEQHGYNAMTIRQWCATAGIRASNRADSIQKALKVLGFYVQTRSVRRAAAATGVSQEYVNKVAQMAEVSGLLGIARGAQRHDPKIKEQLEIIDRANRIINERLVELGERAVVRKAKSRKSKSSE